MLHHLSVAVSDLARSATFYDPTLAALGYVRVWTREAAIGYGLSGGGDKFAIKLADDELAAFDAAQYEACDSEPRACMRPLSSCTTPGTDCTTSAMPRPAQACGIFCNTNWLKLFVP